MLQRWDWLASASVSIVSVLVGSLMTWFIGVRGDRRRAQIAREERLVAIRRDALAAAIDWVKIMRSALERAMELDSGGPGTFKYDAHSCLTNFPDLSSELGPYELSGVQAAALGTDLTSEANCVISEFEELERMLEELGRANPTEEIPYSHSETSIAFSRVKMQIDDFERDLHTRYVATFG